MLAAVAYLDGASVVVGHQQIGVLVHGPPAEVALLSRGDEAVDEGEGRHIMVDALEGPLHLSENTNMQSETLSTGACVELSRVAFSLQYNCIAAVSCVTFRELDTTPF